MKLTRRKIDRRAFVHELPRREVELRLRSADRRLRMTARAAHDRSHTCEQLTQIERLDQIVVRAEIEPRDAIVQTVARGEHEHRRAIAVLPRSPQHFQSRASRQSEIEQHRGVRALRKRILRQHTVAHPVDGQAVLGQRLSQAVTDHIVVFDEQDAHGNAHVP